MHSVSKQKFQVWRPKKVTLIYLLACSHVQVLIWKKAAAASYFYFSYRSLPSIGGASGRHGPIKSKLLEHKTEFSWRENCLFSTYCKNIFSRNGQVWICSLKNRDILITGWSPLTALEWNKKRCTISLTERDDISAFASNC